MLHRCLDPDSKDFHYYGGRGITVCEAWQQSFTAFLCDVGPKPSPRHTIDRIDNDGDYQPGNVRWATRYEQIHNRRPLRTYRTNRRATCLTCGKPLTPRQTRGNCPTCWKRLARSVASGRTTWAALEAEGKSDHPRKQWPNGRPRRAVQQSQD